MRKHQIKPPEESSSSAKATPPVRRVASSPQEEGQLALDVYQTSDEIVVLAPIAGVKMPDLDVAVTDDVLTIKGKRNLEIKVPEEDFFTQECFWGDFSRSIVLPASVDTTKVKATFKNAVLKISIPKVEKTRTKIVRIKAADKNEIF